MLNRKVIVFIMIGIFTCFSVFGQDVAAVKKFERARRTIPVSISLNVFGFGIGSFLQGDTKAALIQLGISTVGYALLLPGIFADFSKTEVRMGIISNSNGSAVPHNYDITTTNYTAKYTLIGIGSVLMAGNAIFGTIRPVMYQFDKQFDTFYDINNEAKWPGGF